MSNKDLRPKAVLMIAYTNYESDPRVIREAEAAQTAGFDVDFLALRRENDKPVEMIRGVRVIRLNQSKYRGGGRLKYVMVYLNFFLRCLLRTTLLHLKRPYAVIHVNNMPDFLVFSTIVPRLLGAKVILDIHDPMPNTFASKFKGRNSGFYYQLLLWQERLSAAYSNRVITVHQPVKDGILVKHGLAPESIEIVANFTDEKMFPLRETFSVEGKVRLVFHGTIHERSGLRIVVNALAKIRNRDRVSLKVVGDGDFSAELKRLIVSLRLEDIVEFDNHSYPTHQMLDHISDCNVGLVPLEVSSVTNYALPLKLLEYVSLGLPVVTVRNDAITFYFNEEDCIFFQWDDVDSLTSVLDKLAENPESLFSYRERSKAVRSQFSWSGEKKKYQSLLRDLAGVGHDAREASDAGEGIQASIHKVTGWVEAHKYRAYDPGDGDLSFLRHFTMNAHFPKRLLTGAVLRVPFHIRPLIGIRPHTSTKGMGYMGWGYTKMYASTGDEGYRRRADYCFKWLMQNRSPGWDQFCWGNNFSFSTRAGTIPKYMPTIVWSSLIGQGFLEAHEVLCNSEYLEVAASAAEWVKRLPREQTSRGDCLSYVPSHQSSIHNSNMLGAALLAKVAQRTDDEEALKVARSAMTYSCTRQNPDGAWYYGEELKFHWIDNFHTGYNLDCLKRYIDSTGDREFEPNLIIGLDYFKRHFFEEDGRPKYFHDKADPIDIQCAAQAIDTLAFFSDVDLECLELAKKVAGWTIHNMQAKDGHFYYRDLGWKKVKTPMFHWGQGTMFKALAHLNAKLSNAPERVVVPNRQMRSDHQGTAITETV